MTKSDGASSAMGNDSSSSIMRIMRSILRDRSFMIAFAVLVVSAAGWTLAIEQLHLIFEKHPLTWPASTVISKDFRLKSLDKKFGNYEMYYTFLGYDAKPDREHSHEMLELLKIGSQLDSYRFSDRTSNWYSSRFYLNNAVHDESKILADIKRADDDELQIAEIRHRASAKVVPHSRWYLDVYFYNGGVDSVPHVAERCQAEAGAEIIPPKTIELDLGANLGEHWSGKVGIRRVIAEFKNKDTGKFQKRVTYYVFCMNGKPESNWINVRLAMSSYGIRYAYFAKIEFGPMGRALPSDVDFDQIDIEAQKFLRAAIGGILKNLPTPEDVMRQENAAK